MYIKGEKEFGGGENYGGFTYSAQIVRKELRSISQHSFREGGIFFFGKEQTERKEWLPKVMETLLEVKRNDPEFFELLSKKVERVGEKYVGRWTSIDESINEQLEAEATLRNHKSSTAYYGVYHSNDYGQATHDVPLEVVSIQTSGLWGVDQDRARDARSEKYNHGFTTVTKIEGEELKEMLNERRKEARKLERLLKEIA